MSDEFLMESKEPPVVKRGRSVGPDEKVIVRRNQLIENPNTWFVWQTNAKNPSYVRKVIGQLLGKRQDEKFSIYDSPYKARVVRNGSATDFTLYVIYQPEEVAQ